MRTDRKLVPPGLVQRLLKRYVRDVILILSGICVLGFVLGMISEFETGGRSRVFAVSSRVGREGYQNEFQAGLMGVVNGVWDMERYSENVRLYHMPGNGAHVLAGASAVEKLAVHQSMMEQGTQKASELGYYAQQLVARHQMSYDEYDTLLRIVEAEATGGDLKSKMLVAGVVLNRVADERFPDTISEVVWQKVGGSAQFQPTSDGRIYSCEITDSTIEAVDRVLQGEDCSEGALFFFARNSSETENVSWFDSSLVWLYEYGGHEYFTFPESAEETGLAG